MRAVARCALLALLLVAVARGQKLDSLRVNPPSHFQRNLIVGNVVFGTAAYFYFEETWGAPNGRFHFKNEFHDNIALTDEVSHFYAGYKLTEGFGWLFRILKMPEDQITKYSALQAGLVVTLVEFPMDAFNPDQGLGVSDLLFDYGGIGWALLRQRYPNNFDMKFCVKRPPWDFENKFLANENEEFANFIWWGTYRIYYGHVGVGYSISHNAQGRVESEYYLGAGTTAYDLIRLVSPKFAEEVKALDSYFISLRLKL
ncbi:MAG: hypothetical protein IT585_08835 [candidate division Zixibacteria bacterium]|nr:hypothetical protein [candidate division Zixibacteria bacterium]